MKRISIFGTGFVGATAYMAFRQIPGYEVLAYDKFPEKSLLYKEYDKAKFVSLEEAANADLCFVCVPTPMVKETGECHVGIVESVISEIRAINKDNEICIKSTVPPGTTKRLNDAHGRIVFNPEFLTEARAYEDFVTLPYQIVGLPGLETENKFPVLESLYKDGFKNALLGLESQYSSSSYYIRYVDSTMAEMVKLTRNCYLATRLSFFNEIKQICDKLEIDYVETAELVGLDKRIGNHYNKVPGPDKMMGFSKSCLPKDINDLMFVASSLGVDPKVLSGVWEKNLEVRPEKDWEKESKAVIPL